MNMYKLVGEFSQAYLDLSRVETVIPSTQVRKSGAYQGKFTYYIAINLRSGNFVKVGYTNVEDRDKALDALLKALKQEPIKDDPESENSGGWFKRLERKS